MPIFQFEKLVRSKLIQEFEKDGQTADYCKLSPEELKRKLAQKVIEEMMEIDFSVDRGQILSEFVDTQQAMDDLAAVLGFDAQEICDAKKKKLNEKGGFSDGIYVRELKLRDDDRWAEYYRKRPDVFPEK